MKIIWSGIILICWSLLFASMFAPTFASGQDTGVAGAKSNILALENAWDQAQERGDAKALAALFDNALIFVDYDGKLLTKAEYLARVKSNDTHMVQIVAEQMSVQVFGNTAIVVGTYRVKGVENGNPYLRRGRFVDTWVLTGGHWICVAAATTPILH
jgi:ketosteroid isomerase-like protein